MSTGDHHPLGGLTYPVDFITHQPSGQPPINPFLPYRAPCDATPFVVPALTVPSAQPDLTAVIELLSAHLAGKDRRIQDLLEANNRYLERARKAEAEVERLTFLAAKSERGQPAKAMSTVLMADGTRIERPYIPEDCRQ